ncbi:hemagglutinin repeat-containing protein [Aggregatibacter segnis]|uniref:Filamentous hemagglutinin outer membrane protein n=2 Tax=Aggregatibacter segnis TaxID=739 RepID=E6KXH5_9PAST|nr:hemagglutinin repeat-containing protein [Aggregatibacter segnis]EFU68206.1 filamentous hemagglutinin outer membrane protein [Aggregatibacter segnis ATCC 33393]QQB09421.1 hemagglutinin repeat-containing protein [Aggregatibacter segnis]SQH64832.1 Filamentous hemagglutinin [Aggregatibacter segnis ATCC 33393]
MNKKHYKVIFSQVLNQLVVVSELAKSKGKATSEDVESAEIKTTLKATALSTLFGTLTPVHFSIMLALGFVFVSPTALANADMAIRADKSAPGNQQPTVLQTANGLPQVNIQTPSAGGVSRNQYSQFDVAEKGAVLNNARKAVQTQTAGWVQGNPNLAAGEAKVILNEVNSSAPSRLKGYVEVAGQKADVVIANPSGIHCDGCGVINAGRATMTTGKAQLENGELKGYEVNGGKVKVTGKGMDNRQADYTDIIAENAQIDGGVWSKKAIKVTTGKNKVDRTNDSVVYVGDKNTVESDRTLETPQTYSVDVSQLGGMYAEKIHLVDNGQGLGVRNAGHIGASAGEVKIDSQGKIVNEGFVGGSENAQLNAKKNIENRGTVYAKAQTQLNAQNIDNKQGVIAGKQVQLNANNVDNRKQSDKGSLIVATEKVIIKAKHVDNHGTKASDKTEQGIRGVQVAITAENLSNQQGGIYADEHANLDVAKTIDNQAGEIEASKSIELKAKALANEGNIKTKGNLMVRLQDSLTLNNAFQVGGNLDFKTEGDFKNNSQLRVGNKADVKAANVENTKDGEISGNETRINANTLTNRGLIDGSLTVAKAVTINNLGTGRIYGDHVALQGESLNNLEEGDKSTVIAARKRLDMGVDKILNRNESTFLSMGKIYVGKALDENNQATGESAYVHNYNGVIEALNLYDNAKSKAITFNTGAVENRHFFLETENIDTSSTPVFEYRIGNDSTIYGKGSGVYKVKQDDKNSRGGLDKKVKNLYHIFSPDGKIESDNWHEYDYTRTVNETMVLKPKYQEGKILSGGGIDFNDARVDNQDSKVIAGGLIQIADGQLNQKEFKGRTIVTDAGHVTAFYKGRACGKKVFGKCIDHYNTTKSDTGIYYKQNERVKDLGVFAYKENMSPEFANNGVANKGDVGDVVLNRLTQSLDKSSLYNVNPNAPKGYVIETAPRFANKQKWLSSDYMFNALRYDPNNMLKRLGDGFYELRLVNEQINQLTGRRYLDGYQNALEQYQGLMNNGIRYAKQFNLVPGVGLTKEQMSELTTDLVWMVNQEITLPSGKKLNVLTPKIYLASNRTQVTPTGSVISGDSIVGSVTNMTNEGTVLAANLVNLHGQNLENKGLVFANNVNLNAEQKLVNLGGKIMAADSVSLYGGKSVELGATTAETQSQLALTETGNKIVDRQSEVMVTGKDGKISIQSNGDITVKAANVKSTGTIDVNAKGKLLVGTEKQSSKEHYDFSDNHHYHLDKEGEVGSVIGGKDGVRLVGQTEATLRQAEVTSANGKVMVASKGDVRIEEGRYIEHLDTRNKQKSRGAFTSVTEEYKHKHNYDLSKGSEIDGNSVVIYSQDGNVTVQGSNVVGENGLTVKAKTIDIKEAENKVYSDDFHSKKKSGVLGGGIGVTFGAQKQTIESDKTKFYAQGSQVGSLNGNTTLIAENDYTQTASHVSAVNGDVNIQAKKVDIKAADDKYEMHTKQTFEQKGVTLAVTSPILSALQAVQGTVKSVERVGQSKNDRVNAMAAANSAMDAYRAGQAVGQAGKAMQEAMENGNMDSVVGVQITYGQQKSESRTHTEGKTAAKSQVNAGGKVNIVATGAGKASNITINGSDVSGKQGTFLGAENDINITAAEQTHKERSTNKSSGFNAGVAIKVSNGVAAGITVGGNYGKGYGNGDETTYVASHVGDANSQTTIQSGGDTNLIGSQVKGKRVEVNADNMNIKSLQDKSNYDGKQTNISGSVTIGYGFSAGGSYNKSKVNADHASVNEQAGIYAGDEGYDINVNKHTDLNGGLITSTQKAEDEGKNRFSTGTITHSDIENHSNYSGSSFGVSGSVAANFDTPLGKEGQAQSSKQATDSKGNPVYLDKNGKETVSATDTEGNANRAKSATGLASLQSTLGLGYGSDKENQSSTTKSGINTKNIEIRDQAGQLAKTGETVEQTLDSIKTDVTTDNAEQHSGKLENHFDKDKVMKELNIQVKVTQDFRKNAFSMIDAYVLPKQAELRKQIKEAKTEEEKTALYGEIYKLQYQKRLLETVVGIVSGSPDVAITQGTLQLAATKMREETLANSRLFKGIKDAKTGKILRNDSYDSGYFDGVKLGGVRIDVNAICNSNMGTCTYNDDNSITFKGNKDYTLDDAIDPQQNKKAGGLYGETGGFQPVQGEWNLHFTRIPYSIGSISDMAVESFAGTHDMLGGQAWGWYDKQGNTAEKNKLTGVASGVTTVIAIPVSAPFALSDVISSDMFELLMKIGGK